MGGDITAASDILGGVSGFVKAMSGQGSSGGSLGPGGVGLPAGAATGGLY
jgi:hypothetical protein